MSKAFIFSITIIFLLLFAYSRISIYSLLEGDPPSIYNYGLGGISNYFGKRIFMHRINIIFNFKNLDSYNPRTNTLLIIGPDKPITEEDINIILKWTSQGGKTIIADESNNTALLLNNIGVSIKSTIWGTTNASCIINYGNTSHIDVLFNVYNILGVLQNINASSLCIYGDSILAIERPYGEGLFIVIGDSSIVINDVLLKSSLATNNTLFMDYVIGDRDIILYEGSRIYRSTDAEIFIGILNALVNALSFIASLIIGVNFSSIFIRVSVLSSIIIVGLIMKFGFPRPPQSYRYGEGEEKVSFDLRKHVLEGLRKWGIVEQ
ncbi:conserved hypothetical protein [Ignisphaera aggregans DSM 17230]|uniref:DUF4350 domain-containing protein n=1 Tax=Ignisphaera aggregans (strain DSM 17230 / JCM 13409 / AQ1.S1) TaxID=583356 RepID=E0SRI7_IGNAA|nr:conserved hypothetical protein [Ignisphaera aggregans DSM 17230]